MQLGAAAEWRWKAPYLTAHRADLQSALLAHVAREPGIQLVTGATVRDVTLHPLGVTASVEIAGRVNQTTGMLVVGADGVWSDMRRLVGGETESRFSGQVAWRRTIRAESPAGSSLARIGIGGVVTAFLAPGFHLITYPVRAGAALNLVAFTRGNAMGETWSGKMDTQVLKQRDAPHRTGAGKARRRYRRVDGLADPHGATGRTMDCAGRHRADWRRSPRDDALCRAGSGDGDRGCGNACRPCACKA